MKDLLIVGDSLAGGLPHICFVGRLESGLRDWRVAANALGGDTLAGIGARLEMLLRERRPDALVIEAGSNDVFLPFIKARGGLWRVLVERLEARGSVPAAGPEAFREVYSRILDGAVGAVDRVAVTTIACIGEDMESEVNRSAHQYNTVIRGEAARRGAAVADTARIFREALAEAGTRSGFLVDNLSCMFTDTLRCLTPRGADRLSGRRGLVLTMDGVHLNRYGAGLYARTVAAALGETI